MSSKNIINSLDFEYNYTANDCIEKCCTTSCCSQGGGERGLFSSAHGGRHPAKLTLMLVLAIALGILYDRVSIFQLLRKDQHNWSLVESKTNTEKVVAVVAGDPIDKLFRDRRKSLQKPLTNQSTKDCFCPNGRHNWIHYTNCPGTLQKNMGAGIKDRQNILRHVMWYADELCANIALQCIPKIWLSEQHGCFAPEDARWDVYFTPVRKRSDGRLVPNSGVYILHSDVNTTKVFKDLKIIPGDPSIKTYEMGRKLHSEGVPFLWNFNISFWNTDLYTPKNTWPKQTLSHRDYSESCGVVDFDTSEELLNIGQLVLQELNITTSQEFVTLHLRRGDWKGCDTSPRSVMKYLKCSIVDDDVQKVLVLTNGEMEYKKNLTRAFNAKYSDKNIVLLDDFIQSKSFIARLEEEQLLSVHSGEGLFLNDNCFRFSVDKVIASMARYHLERGHAYCSRCDPGGSPTDHPIIRY